MLDRAGDERLPAPMFISHSCVSGSFSERVAAASTAGFSGITLSWQEICEDVSLGRPGKNYRHELSSAGVDALAMEYIALPNRREIAGFAANATRIADISAEAGCRFVQAVCIGKSKSFELLVEGFGILTERCAAAGLRCGVEFVPFLSSLPDLQSAITLVRSVDTSIAGLLIDSLHFFRAGAPWRVLEELDVDVLVMQICDAPALRRSDDYVLECTAQRELPGDGEFDLRRFVRTLRRVAPGAVMVAEVATSQLLAMPAPRAARLIADRIHLLHESALTTDC